MTQLTTAQKIIKSFANDSWQTQMGAVELAFIEGLISNTEHTQLTAWYSATQAQVRELEKSQLFGEVFA